MVVKTLAKLSFLTFLTISSFAYDFPERGHSGKERLPGFSSRLPNEKRVDDIFNLLADVEPRNDIQSVRKIGYNRPTPTGQNYRENIDQNLLDDPVQYEETKDNNNPSTLQQYFKLIDFVSKSSLINSEPMEEFLTTFNKVSKMYDHQKHKIYSKLPKDQAFYYDNVKENAGVLKSTTAVIGNLLDPPNIEKVLNASRTAENEDEILELLTSVILGAEDRGGGYGGSGHHGLTLDAVTCIALLTLAAYLIRAVFQILTANDRRKRSLVEDSSEYKKNEFSPYERDIASEMVRIHNMISPKDEPFSRNREETTTKDNAKKSAILRLPSEIALVFKLNFDGQESCFRKFLCQHLAGRSIFDFGASELFWSAVGLYKGEYGIANLISKDYYHKDKICEAFSKACKNTTEESCSKCSSKKTTEYRKVQTFVHKLVEMFVHRSEYLESFFK